MSIIYDALQKTQKKREATVSLEVPIIKAEPVVKIKARQSPRRLLILALIFLVTLALNFASSYIKPVSKPLQTVTTPAPLIQQVVPKLTLSGVFLSDHEKIAMINQHPYHVGDSLYGMKVIAIELNRVKLKSEFRTIVLH